LIAYSMQIRRGKAWEISSRAVMSGRQMVDTRGDIAYPRKGVIGISIFNDFFSQ